jgi:hypothetical protein
MHPQESPLRAANREPESPLAGGEGRSACRRLPFSSDQSIRNTSSVNTYIVKTDRVMTFPVLTTSVFLLDVLTLDV